MRRDEEALRSRPFEALPSCGRVTRYFRDHSSVRARAGVACLAGLVVTLIVGVGQALHEIRDLESHRDQTVESEWDVASAAGTNAKAFRRLRATLDAGERFALVFSEDTDRDQRGLYNLVSLAYLYPALARSNPADADAVMVFGMPSTDVRRAFDEIGVIDGVWLGRRSS